MKPARLTPAQLCDLLNFVLGLPQRNGTKTVIRPAINPCVVTGWRVKPARRRAEAWCDAQLMSAGVIPSRPRHGGPMPGRYVPPEVEAWSPRGLRRAAA